MVRTRGGNQVSNRSIPRWLRVGLSALFWLAGCSAVWLALTLAVLPVLSQNGSTLFAYELLDEVDEVPYAATGVAVVGLATLLGSWWLSRSWKTVAWIITTGAVLAGVGLAVGQLFGPWKIR